MNAYEQLIERLFSALSRGDFRSAADCYRDDSEYRDIAFNLKGQRDIAAMWHFVCSKRVDVIFRDIRADERSGSAHWEARYRYSKTGRPVHNRIESTFTFRDDKILVHHDHSSRWRWARQALGFMPAIPVTVLPFLMRQAAAKELEAFEAKPSVILPGNARV